MMNFLIFIKKFNSYEWKTQPQKRKYYLRSLLKTDLIIAKTPDEIEELLGRNESFSQIADRWTYALNIDMKTGKKYFLAVYFENNRVIKVRKEYKKVFQAP